MLIEIFKNNLEFITGMRYSWKPWATNKPIKENVYRMKKSEIMELKEKILNNEVMKIAKKGKEVDRQFGNLKLHLFNKNN